MAQHGAGMRAGVKGLVLACAACWALPAAAQVQSDITVSNLRYVLTDLTADDGQAPTFTFTDADLSPIALSAAVTPQPGQEQAVDLYDERSGYLDFSPHTQVSLTVDLHVAVQAAPGLQQSGSVWVGFLAGATWGPPKDSWERRDGEDDYRDAGDVFGGYKARVDRDGTLTLTFVNDSDYAAYGHFRIQVESHAYAAAAPVPEAPMPAMLAAGLGLLGIAGRRRAAKRRA